MFVDKWAFLDDYLRNLSTKVVNILKISKVIHSFFVFFHFIQNAKVALIHRVFACFQAFCHRKIKDFVDFC